MCEKNKPETNNAPDKITRIALNKTEFEIRMYFVGGQTLDDIVTHRLLLELQKNENHEAISSL